MNHYAEDAATLRRKLEEMGIHEPMWGGFHWTCKTGPHIRRDSTGNFELTIIKKNEGYNWKLERVHAWNE